MRPPLSEAQLAACQDPDFHLDTLFGRVFATPDGKALIAELRRLGRDTIPLDESETRVTRMRHRWGDRSYR